MTPIYISFLILIPTMRTAVINGVTENSLTFTPKYLVESARKAFVGKDQQKTPMRLKKLGMTDIELAKRKAKMVRAARTKNEDLAKGMPLSNVIKGLDEKQRYHLDSLVNVLKRSWRKKYSDDLSDTSSSSIEMKDWKDDWREYWLQKKFEAINSTQQRGDTVNMAAARPWGVQCGDPKQYDMPWGTCMLPMECEAEYRIFRGDHFCGTTEFVCCALQLTSYDMYQGFDVSFADSSLQTDSEEKKNRDRGSKEKRARKKLRDKRKRKRDRLRRKRKMKRQIKKIVREIRKILDRTYRNGTTERKRKTRELKKFVKMLKKKYKDERRVIMDLHEIKLIQTDAAIQEKLNQIKSMNREFIKNGTFRDIVVNGTINQEAARMLLLAYPELASRPKTRRVGERQSRDYLDYDIEYGYLYYS